jgi:hypothetical protein
MISNRGAYSDGWYACPTPPVPAWVINAKMPPYKWELYDLTEDYSQANDWAVTMPDKLKEMQAIFLQEAKKYQVLRLDNRSFARAAAPKPSATAGQTIFTYTGSDIGRSYTITADVDVPQGGGDGVNATQGGRFGGYGFYVLKGKRCRLASIRSCSTSPMTGPASRSVIAVS